MNLILSLIILIGTTSAFAADHSSIEILVQNGTKIKIDWLGEDVDESEVEMAWDMGGAEALINGQLCFNGNTEDVSKILYSLSDSDFLGDEFSIRNVVPKNETQMSFEVYDKPNDWVHMEVTIGACSDKLSNSKSIQ
ncbi:MAG: hypothetical protein K2Q26_05425 [Bdellovibrionales bacterium]|nr:hypothetical protein [Bdellovibrionales bacterium]